jgi:uncharacterized RDD family membrane protein YckC
MQYYYAIGTQQIGPVGLDQLKAANIKPETLVWRQGLAQWVAASTLPELNGLFGGQIGQTDFTGQAPPPVSNAGSPINPQPSYQPNGPLGVPQPRYGQPQPSPQFGNYQQNYAAGPNPNTNTSGAGLPTRYATFGERFLAQIIDVFVQAFVIYGVMGVILVFVALEGGGEVDFGPKDLIKIFQGPLLLVFNVISFLTRWLYEAVMTSSSWQATLGKRAMGLVVTDTYGARLSFGKSLARTMSKVLSELICYIGYLMMLNSDKKQTLHDRIVETIVLKELK